MAYVRHILQPFEIRPQIFLVSVFCNIVEIVGTLFEIDRPGLVHPYRNRQ